MVPPLIYRCEFLAPVILVGGLLGCGQSAPDKAEHVAARPSAPPSRPAEPPGRKAAAELPASVPFASQPLSKEEPAWLTAARDNPDPSVRAQALETWAQRPGATLDPFTYALVDGNESVRARAQELLEEELARR
jgi:hypothetical protein